MNKKIYETPLVKKINLAAKNSVLNICSTSVNVSPASGSYCEASKTDQCFWPWNYQQ